MSEHAYDVERAFLNPDGPQRCCCLWVEPNLRLMKRHIKQPEYESPVRPPETLWRLAQDYRRRMMKEAA